jgi:hypothetical protein
MNWLRGSMQQVSPQCLLPGDYLGEAGTAVALSQPLSPPVEGGIVLAIVLLYCILQRAVFIYCPFTRTFGPSSRRSWRVWGMCHLLYTCAIFYYTVVSFDLEPAQK